VERPVDRLPGRPTHDTHINISPYSNYNTLIADLLVRSLDEFKINARLKFEESITLTHFNLNECAVEF